MKQYKFKSIEDVWKSVDAGETIYWSSTAYKIYVCADSMPSVTLEYKPRRLIERNGRLLEVRCIDNYFGSILNESDLSSLFTVK